MSIHKFPKAGQAVKECQSMCARTPGCAYFSMEFPDRLCSMAGSNAIEMHPVFKHIAGPPSCENEHDGEMETTIRQFLERGHPDVSFQFFPAISAILTAAAVSGGLLLYFYRTGRSAQLCFYSALEGGAYSSLVPQGPSAARPPSLSEGARQLNRFVVPVIYQHHLLVDETGEHQVETLVD